MTEVFESVPIWMMVAGFLLVLGPLITLHELGHYLVGRFFGVKADVFSVGFGKELLGRTDKLGTRWKLSAIPLGGYVQFAGDMNPASLPTDEWLALPEHEREKTFQAKTLWQRTLIVAAGPVMNFIIAIVILASFNLAYGVDENPAVVTGLQEGGAAISAGVEVGDRIIAVDDVKTPFFRDLAGRVMLFPGERVVLELVRDGRTIKLPVVLELVNDHDRFGNKYSKGLLGVTAAGREHRDLGLGGATALAFTQTGNILDTMVTGIGQVITGRRSVKELGGPIKIAKISGETLSLGWKQLITFAAFISINLAFINLLPIPALDGGHLAFYAAEAVRRKPASPRFQDWAQRIGISLLLALMLFLTVNDIASLPIFGG